MSFNLYQISSIFLRNLLLKNVLYDLFTFFRWKKIPLMMQRSQKRIKSHVSNMLHITIDKCMCNISLLCFFLLPDANIALSIYFQALKTYSYKFIVLLYYK